MAQALLHRMRRSKTCEEFGRLSGVPGAPSSMRSTMLTSTSLSEALEDWMYWQRDASDATCWTKVFGVLENEFLWLFKGHKSPKTLFMQIAVASVEESGERQLRVVDPNGLDMEIWLLDKDSFTTWRHRLEDAAALTTEFFRATELEANKLPKGSAYRGSLVSYRRIKKRARCRAAIQWIAAQWKQKLLLPPSSQ
jgi:hypothetical protein